MEEWIGSIYMYDSQRHPERLADEVFLTNSTEETFPRIAWRTKRKGKIAFDRSGFPITDSWGYFPVFVKRVEIEEYEAKPTT